MENLNKETIAIVVKFNSLIAEIIGKGIPCTGVGIGVLQDGWNHLSYEFNGFSKSGTGRLVIYDNTIQCHTRYGRIDIIENFEDFCRVAFDWYNAYREREPFGSPDPAFLKYFEEYDWI